MENSKNNPLKDSLNLEEIGRKIKEIKENNYIINWRNIFERH